LLTGSAENLIAGSLEYMPYELLLWARGASPPNIRLVFDT